MTSSPTMPRWQEVLLGIYRSRKRHRYAERLHRLIKGSRTYIREVVRRLAAYDLIQIVPTKKIKKLKLTERGRKVIHSILEMQSLMA